MRRALRAVALILLSAIAAQNVLNAVVIWSGGEFPDRLRVGAVFLLAGTVFLVMAVAVLCEGRNASA